MKRFLVFSLIALFLATPAIPTMANDNAMEIEPTYLSVAQENDHQYEEIEATQLFIDDQFSSSSGQWFGNFRSGTSRTGRNFNVFFQNTSNNDALVTLQRQNIIGSWVDVGNTFTVRPGENPTVQRTAQANTEHRLRVISSTGGQVSGHARVRQIPKR